MDDVGKASAVVADMRKIIRQDPRIIQKLHRRVFFDKLTREQVISKPGFASLYASQAELTIKSAFISTEVLMMIVEVSVYLCR